MSLSVKFSHKIYISTPFYFRTYPYNLDLFHWYWSCSQNLLPKKWYGHVWMPKTLLISWFLLTPPCRTKDSWILSIFSNDDIFLYAASDRAATPGSVLPVERKINRKLFPLLHLFTFLIAIEEFMSITICKLTSQSLSYVRRCDITIELIKKVPRHFSVSFYGSVKVQVFYIYHIQLMRTITWQLCKFLDFLVLLINLQQ